MANNVAFIPPPQLTDDPNSNWQVEVWKQLSSSTQYLSDYFPATVTDPTSPIDPSSHANFDARPGLQAYLSYCVAHGITTCTLPPGTYFLTPFLDLRGISSLHIYAYGCRFIQHPASVFYIPNPDSLYPGYAFNGYIPAWGVSGQPGMLLADYTTSNVVFYGVDFDFNYLNTDHNAFNLHFDCYQATGLVFKDCTFKRLKSQIFMLSCVDSGFDGGTHGEMAFGSQTTFIINKQYLGTSGKNDLLVKATTFKGWLQQDKRRYQIKIVSPVSGIDQFVWSLARGGYLGISASSPTMIANSTVSPGVTSGYSLAAGTINLTGLGVVPMNTWAAVAVDITLAGAITLTSAPANTTTGYSTSDLAFSAIPAVAVGLFRVGQFAVSNPAATFTFGTDSLQALNANFITQCGADTAHDSFSPYGPFTTVPRPCIVGNSSWYATPDNPDDLHLLTPVANDPLLWDDGTPYKDMGQSYDGGQAQTYLMSIPILSVAFASNTGHTIGDIWSFRWTDTRLAAIAINGVETPADPTTIPKRDCFFRNMDGPLSPCDLHSLFISNVNGFILDGCTNLTASFYRMANFKCHGNDLGYSEWGLCSNGTFIGNSINRSGDDLYANSGLGLHFTGNLQNITIIGNDIYDYGIDPSSSGTYTSAYSGIRFDSTYTYNHVVVSGNNFRNERTDVFSNRVWYGIYGQQASYEGMHISDNTYSDHVVPLAGDASFITAAMAGQDTRQNYGYTFSGAYSLVNQDSGVHCRIDFATPLATSMRLAVGSYLSFTGSSNVSNNINYTVAKEVRDANDSITAIIFSTAVPDPTTATFTGISCPPQIVPFYNDDVTVTLTGTTSNIYVNPVYMSKTYSGRLHIIGGDTASSTNAVTFVGGTFVWPSGQSLKPPIGNQYDVIISNNNAIITSRNSQLNASLNNNSPLGTVINYDVSTATTSYCYGQLVTTINSNPVATTLGYYNQNLYQANGPISHTSCNLSQSFLNDASGGLAHIDTVKLFNSLIIWGASTVSTLIHFEAKTGITSTGIGTEYGFKVTNLTGNTAKWAFYCDKTFPSFHAGQYLFGGTPTSPLGSFNSDGTITISGGTAGGVAFADAIHKSVAAEISTVAAKTTPAAADLLLIEDSAAGNAKKSITIGSLPSSGGGTRPFVQLTADNATVAQCNANSIFLCANSQTTFTIPYGVNVGSRISIIPLTATTIQGATGVSYQSPTGTIGTAVFVKANVNTVDMVCALTNTWLIEGQGAHKLEEHTDYGTSASIQKVGQLYWDSFAIAGYAPVAITNAVNNGSGLIRITSMAHGLATTNSVVINGVGGVTAANGAWIVTVIDANTYDLNGSTFSGTYTSGGTGTRARQYGPGGSATNSFGDPAYYTLSLTGGSIQVLLAGNYRVQVSGEIFFLTNSGSWHYTCQNGVMVSGGNRYLLNSAAAYGSQSFVIDRITTCAANDVFTLIADCETAGTSNYPGRLTFSVTKLS